MAGSGLSRDANPHGNSRHGCPVIPARTPGPGRDVSRALSHEEPLWRWSVNKVTDGKEEKWQMLGDAASPKYERASSRARQARKRGSGCGCRGNIPEGSQKRNWSTFEQMFSGSRGSFVRMAYRILQNKEDAEDAVQDALVSSYVHLGSFKGRSALKTWFTRIVLNAALMIRRKRKPAAVDSVSEWATDARSPWVEAIPSPEPDPENSCAKSETLGVIEELIAQLKPTLRQALTMSWFEEMPASKACAFLGVSTATFKARLFRARKQLISEARRSLAPLSSKTALHSSSNKIALAAAAPAQIGPAGTELR